MTHLKNKARYYHKHTYVSTQSIVVTVQCQNRPITHTYPTRYVHSRNKCEKQAKHKDIENIRSIRIKDCVESATIVLNFCRFTPCCIRGLFRHFTGRCCKDERINFLHNISTNPLCYIGVKPQDVWSTLVIIIIIHHELGLDRPVPASSRVSSKFFQVVSFQLVYNSSPVLTRTTALRVQVLTFVKTNISNFSAINLYLPSAS
jgi:hypothetical protein